jgi:hypothetical protein
MYGLSENRELGNICVRAFVCVRDLSAKIRVSVLDDYRSRIFLALLTGGKRIWLINLNSK